MAEPENKNRVTDIVMILSAILLIIFTITILVIFCITGQEPSTLVASFFAAFGIEGGYCAFIWKTKRRDKLDERRNISESGLDSDQCCGDDSDLLSDPLAEDES